MLCAVCKGSDHAGACPNLVCVLCKDSGHRKNNCPNKEQFRCPSCNQLGHKADVCPHRNPPRGRSLFKSLSKGPETARQEDLFGNK